MKKRKHSLLIIVLAAAIALSSAACAGEAGNGAESAITVPGNGKWVDSSIRGTITAESEPRLQDDFAAAANKEYILELAASTDEDDAVGSLELMDQEIKDQCKELFDDESVSGKYAVELRKYVALARDYDLRNSQGVEPLRPYIDAITSISSIDELIAYEKDLQKNPFGMTMLTDTRSYAHNETSDTPVSLLGSMPYSLGDSIEYFNISNTGFMNKAVTDERTEYLLGRLGFDKKEISKILNGCYHVELTIAKNDMQLREGKYVQQRLTREDINNLTGNYPCIDILDSRGASYERFQADETMLRGINSFYKEKNLEDIKSYYIVHLLSVTESFLDVETLKKMYNRSSELTGTEGLDDDVFEKDKDELVLTYIDKSYMTPALSQTWFEKNYDQKTADEIMGIANEYRDYYKELLGNTEWLSAETRAAAIKKVDNLVVHVGKPSIDVDYTDCNIKTAEDGGSFLEACAESFRYRSLFKQRILALGNSNDIWDPYVTNALESNAYYEPSQNAIYVLWGFVQNPLYSPDMSYEQKLGGIGVFIGHEITHAFDVQGSQTDYEGNLVSWMNGEDNSNFLERTAKVSSYYSMITPFPGASAVDGSKVANEEIADLGGIKGALAIAKKHEGFDYDKFFRQYAKNFARQISENMEKNYLSFDEHPLNYLRINVGLQQFDEFIETYDIKPGDGMYLAPEYRICVW